MNRTNARLLVSMAFCGAFHVHAGGQSASLRGVVRGDGGAAVGGAAVTLKCEAIPARSAQTTSAQDGTYRLAALLPCEYRLSAAFADTASVPAILSVTLSSDEVRDLDLLSSRAVQGSAASAEKPRLAASGIRGLIDPGGYSAPANAAAATGMLSGMAGVQREENADRVHTDCAEKARLLRAVAQAPANAAANFNLGKFYLKEGAYRKALPLLQVALQGKSKDRSASLDVAEALLGLQRFEEARAQLESLPNDPQNARLHRLLARADEGLGRFREASAEYQQLSKLDPSEMNLFGAGYEMILDGRPADAALFFGEAVRRFPQSVPLWIGKGTAQFLQGETLAAVDPLLRAAELDPADPRPYPFLAAAWAASSTQAPRVLATTQRHTQLAPRDAEGLLAYATMLERAKKPDTTDTIRALLQRAVALQPDLAQAHFELGVLDARSGENVEAVAEFQRVLTLDPTRTEAHYRLSLAYRKNGQTAMADSELMLFQQSRAHDSESETADLRQFLSVMQQPKETPPANSCPEMPPT